jgi:hypothetical protein
MPKWYGLQGLIIIIIIIIIYHGMRSEPWAQLTVA